MSDQHSHPEYASKESVDRLGEEIVQMSTDIREVRSEIRTDIRDMATKFEGWQASIASGIAALGTQLSTYQVSMPKEFIARPEAERIDDGVTERFKAHGELIKQNARDIAGINTKLWAIAVLAIGALVSALTGSHIPLGGH